VEALMKEIPGEIGEHLTVVGYNVDANGVQGEQQAGSGGA